MSRVQDFLKACNIPSTRTRMSVLYGKAAEMSVLELKEAKEAHLTNKRDRLTRLMDLRAPTIVIRREEEVLLKGDAITRVCDKFIAQKESTLCK